MSTATNTAASTATTKAPSKKSQADAIFATHLVALKAGTFTTNKDFRAAVLAQIQTDLGVSVASAATMYNSAKQDAETADTTLKLGRDPKKEKPASTGKRGRPVGSGKKTVDTTSLVDTAAPAQEPVADAVV